MIIEYKKEYTQKEFDQIKEILNQTKEITIKRLFEEIKLQRVVHMAFVLELLQLSL